MSFPTVVGLNYGDDKVVSSNDRGRALGTRGSTPDGRVFRWAQCGGVDIAAAMVCQTAVEHGASALTANIKAVSSAIASGLSTLSFTAGASGLSTGVARNQYKDGYLTIDTAPGEGSVYRIAGNDSGSSLVEAEFRLAEPFREALSSVTEFGIRRNPYTSVIIQPTTKTGVSIGVTPADIATTEFFWLQTWGWCTIQADAEVAAGTTFTIGATAGNIAAQASGAGDVAEPILGWAPTAGAQGTDKPQWVYLMIAP
jgi:hypothetical protein